MAARLSCRPAPAPSLDGHPASAVGHVLASLPSLDEIMAAPVATRDFVSAGLLPMAEKEFLRCVARVLQSNCPDA